jgi:hypothetical protein
MAIIFCHSIFTCFLILDYLDTLMQHLDQQHQVFSPHYLLVAGQEPLFLKVGVALAIAFF